MSKHDPPISPADRYDQAARACTHRAQEADPPCRDCVVEALTAAEEEAAHRAARVGLDTTIGGALPIRGPLQPADRL